MAMGNINRIKISQSDNYAGNHGLVIRSSSNFYYKVDAGFKTCITFMDYWRAKRGIEVAVVASLRDADGTLLSRELLQFENREVINYRPVPPYLPFEGSVEIEVFGTNNLVIPFAGIIGIYETEASSCMVHTYARAYWHHEIEEGRMIPVGRESNWSIRDDAQTRSFCVFHNGMDPQVEQVAEITVQKRDRSSMRRASFRLPKLAPYQIVKVYPEDHFPDLIDFLGGEGGNATMSFVVNRGFSRMLIGNESRDGREFQATHSNFNYSAHQSELIQTGGSGYMVVPQTGMATQRVVIYPDCEPGRYSLRVGGKVVEEFDAGTRLEFDCDGGVVEIARTDGALPARVPTGLYGATGPGVLPFECSLGVLHNQRPPKRMWWGPVSATQTCTSKMIVTPFEAIYGAYDAKAQPVCLRLYGQSQKGYLERWLKPSDYVDMQTGTQLSELFPQAEDFLANDYGYYTAYSDYGGHFVYSTLDHKSGATSIEHGF